MGREQRSIKNVFKTARQVRGYYFQIAGVGILLAAGLMASSFHMIHNVSMALNTVDIAVSGDVQNQLFLVMMLYLASFVLFTIGTLGCLIIVGHRVGGATVAICAYIRDLKNGNYESQRALRDKDELGPIMMELVDLAQQLKAQNKNTK